MKEKMFFVFFDRYTFYDRYNKVQVYRIKAESKEQAESKLCDFINKRSDQLSKYGLRLTKIVELHQLPTLEEAGEILDNHDNKEIIKDILT